MGKIEDDAYALISSLDEDEIMALSKALEKVEEQEENEKIKAKNAKRSKK